MTLISAYVPTLDAPKDSKKVFYDNLSVTINTIHAKGKRSFLDMLMPEFVRTTTNCMNLFEITILGHINRAEKLNRSQFGGHL